MVTNADQQLTRTLSSTFQSNILIAHNNARIIISGNGQSTAPIASKEQTIKAAEQLHSNAHLEFSLARVLSLAYRSPIIAI